VTYTVLTVSAPIVRLYCFVVNTCCKQLCAIKCRPRGLIDHVQGLCAIDSVHRIGEAEEIRLERLEPRFVWLGHRETSEK